VTARATVLEVFRAIETVPTTACGALVRRRDDGATVGAVLVEHGRVCWAISDRQTRHLTDALAEATGTLSRDQLNELFAECRAGQLPLGETLIARGLVALPVLHRTLLRHTCEAIEAMARDGSSTWAWVEHRGRGYHPMLTFCPAEILVGVSEIEEPARAHAAAARLRATLRDGERGLALRARAPALPIAQIGCEALDLPTLADLIAQATEATAIAMTLGVEVIVSELGDLACATWADDGVLFVVVREGELAFNRLLAQVAQGATTTHHL